MRSIAGMFRRRAGDVRMSHAAAVPPSATCRETAETMARTGSSAVIVAGANGRPLGIVTERDIARRPEFCTRPDDPVAAVMSTPVETINAGAFLYEAIGRMRRARLRHMPVVDGEGRVTGLLDLHTAYEAAIPDLVVLIDRLTHEETLVGLRHVKEAQVPAAAALFEDGLEATEIQRLISDLNRDIHARAVDLLIQQLDAEGFGPPPADFCVIIMGSGGRGESFLRPDQDNGFIVDDYPDADHNRIDLWFRELAERLTRVLDEVGFPYCKGFVMATNPLWRKTRRQWRDQMDIWFRQRQGASARFADIFFDFVPVWGRHDFATELRRHVTDGIARDFGFLRDMYQLQAGHDVAIGFLGRLLTERRGAHRGKLSLKYRGTLPLVEGVRLMALRHRVPETSTLARIEALAGLGELNRDDQDYLAHGFHHLSRVLMQRQIEDWQAGATVSNYVAPSRLTRREKDILRDCFRAIDLFRRRLQGDYLGSVL